MRYSAKVLSVVALFLFLSWPQGQAAVFDSVARGVRPLSAGFARNSLFRDSIRSCSTEASEKVPSVVQKQGWRGRARDAWEPFNSVMTLVARVGGGVASVWIGKSAYDFNKEQKTQGERLEFLGRTRDYVNNQLERKMVSDLYADAQTKQTRLEFLCPNEERLAFLQKYRKNEQKIQMALEYNEAVRAGVESAEGEAGIERPLIEDILINLRSQSRDLKFALHLNRTLYHVINESYKLADKEASELINLVNADKPTEVTKSRLATIHNLRGMIQFRKESTRSDKKSSQYQETMERIIKEHFSVAEGLHPENPYSYVHQAYVYRSLCKAQSQESKAFRDYLEKIEKSVLRAYQVAPRDPSTLNTMGLYKRMLATHEADMAALCYFEEALTLRKGNSAILHNLARVHLSLGERKEEPYHFEAAFRYAEDARKVRPSDISILGAYVEASAHCKKCKEASDKFEKLKVMMMREKEKQQQKNSLIDEADEEIELKAKEVFEKHCSNSSGLSIG